MMAVDDMRVKRALATLVLGCLLCLSSFAAEAASSRDEAAREALQQHGGKVLSITESTTAEGQRQYIVKVLSDGRVRLVRIRRED